LSKRVDESYGADWAYCEIFCHHLIGIAVEEGRYQGFALMACDHATEVWTRRFTCLNDALDAIRQQVSDFHLGAIEMAREELLLEIGRLN
ncbi:MAG: hypothetical protein AAGA75_11645, partial [Cyanobacteria bacterium P01_E01_bin.6]